MMTSSIQSFSTEIFFEIFDYLSPYECFYAFIDLNSYFRSLVGFYPLHLDFRKSSRLKFDFLCKHLQPEQVRTLAFGEKYLPKQVLLFQQRFPRFQRDFVRLKTLKFIRTTSIIHDIPHSVSSLVLQDLWSLPAVEIFSLVSRQANQLVEVFIDDDREFQRRNISFPKLKSLTARELTTMTLVRASLTRLSSIFQQHQLIQNVWSQLPKSLTHLTIILPSLLYTNTSFDQVHNSLMALTELKHLTIIATSGLDFTDGKRWEECLSKTKITKFNFSFEMSPKLRQSINPLQILEPYRRPFWLKEKRWYIAYYEIPDMSITMYSFPYFQSNITNCRDSIAILLTTMPSNAEQKLLVTNMVDRVNCDSKEMSTLPTDYFPNVRCVDFNCYSWSSMQMLTKFINLESLRELILVACPSTSFIPLNRFLQQCPHLHHLAVPYVDQSLSLPQQVYSLAIKKPVNDIDVFCETFPHITHLDFFTDSIAKVRSLIKKHHHLEYICFHSCEPPLSQYEIIQWFSIDIRIGEKQVTCHTPMSTSSCMYFSIGDVLA